MVCLDRDRGAICCCSGGARLPRGSPAGAGTGDRRRRGRRSGRRSPALAPEAGFVAADGSRDAAGAGPRCRNRRELRALVFPRARSRALACGGSRRGDGDDEVSCPSPALLDWACKELKKKKYIYICVVSSAKVLNLYSFSAPSAP